MARWLVQAALLALAQSLEIIRSSPQMNVTVLSVAKLGPFETEPEACDYCAQSFTKAGGPQAGPVTDACVCMALPDADNAGKFTMFCATPPSAAGYVKEKEGCKCKFRDMEAMGKTTCKAL
ncbi:unnamed protein product [Cladocopium goreaui]|nr:unnamed protein product [Cladocopium goreaui]|mmetsp:Transcript_39782/g.86059  ORF Transcript_39782/g.86059 Transcript_39782/m.86059 type:complete len:121 (+) Transcript_39782:62-424(+)